MEHLRAWLTDLNGHMDSVLESERGMGLTEAQMAALEAEAKFYANLLLLFDTGSAPEPSSMEAPDEMMVRGFIRNARHWEQRNIEEVMPGAIEDNQRQIEVLRRLREYAERYPTTNV
jgi:hypothetical protein